MVYLRLSIIKIRRSVSYATKEARMAQNNKQTEDLRVRRTRKLLMQALIDLTIYRTAATQSLARQQRAGNVEKPAS
jgi:hypothetical protein